MWIFWSFLTAIIESGKDVLSKRNSIETDEYMAAFLFQAIAILFLLPLVLWAGVPELKPGFWWLMLASTALNPAWSLLYMKAVKLSSLSTVMPMLAFNPIITALLSFVLEREHISSIGWIGILLVSVGIYVQRLDPHTIASDWLSPITSLAHDPGSLYMLGVGFIWSIGAYVTKFSSTTSSPLFASLIATIASSLVLGILAYRKSSMRWSSLPTHEGAFFLLGGLNALSKVTLRIALSLGLTPYVMPIKRTNIVWSSLAGTLVFGEKLTKQKLIGLGLLIAGVVLIMI